MGILSVRDLTISFNLMGSLHPAVNGVSFDVERNETLCNVGESGCGKSITALSIMGPLTPAAHLGGVIEYDVQNLLDMSEEHLETLRGDKLSMIFQEPMTLLHRLLCPDQTMNRPRRSSFSRRGSLSWRGYRRS